MNISVECFRTTDEDGSTLDWWGIFDGQTFFSFGEKEFAQEIFDQGQFNSDQYIGWPVTSGEIVREDE